MARRRRRRKPELTHEEKLQRRDQYIRALQEKYGPKLVIFGDCPSCLLPLLVPGVRVPLHTTFEWDDESPALNQQAPEYCVERGCARKALQAYEAAYAAGIQIRGVYHGPPPRTKAPLDTPEGP